MINKPFWLVEMEKKGGVNPEWNSPSEARYYNKDGSFFETTLEAFTKPFSDQKSFCALVWDGFFPHRDGATMRTASFLQGLGKKCDLVLVLAWREWASEKFSELAKSMNINIMLINSQKYYSDDVLQKVLSQFDNVIIRDFEIINNLSHPNIFIDCQELRWRLLSEQGATLEEIENIKLQELQAFNKAKKIFAISKVEIEMLKQNGILPEKLIHVSQSFEPTELAEIPTTTRDRLINILFLGHFFYEPNYKVAEYIVKVLEPAVRKLRKNVRFHLIGLCPDSLRLLGNKNVLFYNHISAEELNVIAQTFDFAIAPLEIVVGQIAKIMTYIQLRLPVLCSIQAVQGYENLICKGITVASLSTFPEAVIHQIDHKTYVEDEDVDEFKTENVFRKVLEELKK